MLRLGEPDAVGKDSMTFAYCARWIVGYGFTGRYAGPDIREELLLIGFADNQTVARYEVMKESWDVRGFCSSALIEYWSPTLTR